MCRQIGRRATAREKTARLWWFLVISEAGLCTFVMGSRNIIKVLAVAGLRDVLVPL